MSKNEKKKCPPLCRVLRVIAILFCAGLLFYAGVVGYVCYREVSVPQAKDYDSIIVLGAQVLPTGEPSVQLRWRLDKARELYDRSPCPIVVCGAMAGMEPRPEGEVMRQLLVSEGVPDSDVLAETESQNTKENLKLAQTILDGMGRNNPVIVTSDYHLPRALAIAEDAGLKPQGAGSLCRPELEFWAKNHLREALAWIKYWLVKYLHLPL